MHRSEQAKDSIRQRFCRAAASYDRYAHIQRQSAAWLVAQLSDTPRRILEIGCGTGNLTTLLAQRFPAAGIDAVDFADTMLVQARNKVGKEERIRFHCADAERFLRTSRAHYDLVASNATLQWFADLPATFGQVARLLRPGGMAVLSLFGPASFQELAAAMRAVVDPHIRLPAESFCAAPEAEAFARQAFSEVEVTSHLVQRRYDTFFDILEHISKTGTGGYHHKVPRLGRALLQGLDQWFVEQGGYTITYEIYILRCRAHNRKGE
ncbi:MAG: hypothetical protein C0613_11040 [Desulfobulbaceae bacterium]|nr:MAG: hypothetical protein C0613_11040 [Desulfobulbaceae bacterium]